MKEDPFRVVVSEDNHVEVEFSEAFVALSIEEQRKAMEAFYWQKASESQAAFDVGKEAVTHEMIVVLAGSMLGKLKRGEPVESDGQVDVSLEDLVTI